MTAPQSADPQHFALPFRILPTGSHATVAQDTPDDVTSCVSVLLRTRIGQRVEVPGYGVPDPTFMAESQHWPIVLEAAVQEWEPRAAGASIPVTIHQDGRAEVMVGVPTTPNGPAV